MNRRQCLLTTGLASAGAALFPSITAFAASDGRIGNTSREEWDQVNRDAAAKVAAIRPDSSDLSSPDQTLLGEIVTGGMMQLELSRVAADQASSEDVKAYAQAEVAEQAGLSAKLREIAGAKGITLPEKPDAKTAAAVDNLRTKSGDAFDAEYLRLVGVEGHRALERTMDKVESSADDDNLRRVAAIALPLIRFHLQTAREEVGETK